MTATTSVAFYLLEVDHQVQHTLKGRGLHKGVNIRKWESLGSSSRLPSRVINTKYRTEKQDYQRNIEVGAILLALAYF